MNRRSFAALLLAPLALWACSSGPTGGAPPPPPPPPGPPPPPPPPPPGDANFSIIDNAFVDPGGNQNANAEVTIVRGQSVGWVHNGNNVHTVTSTSAPGGDDFNSGNLTGGQTFEFTPSQAGTYIFRCEIHPAIMRDSRIIVNEP